MNQIFRQKPKNLLLSRVISISRMSYPAENSFECSNCGKKLNQKIDRMHFAIIESTDCCEVAVLCVECTRKVKSKVEEYDLGF